MDRINRLAHLLSKSGRVAQPMDDPDSDHEGLIRPSRTDVKPGSHTYRDTDDLREEADEEDDDEMEQGEGSHLLFGGDDDDFDEIEDHEDVGQETLRKARIKLMAGLIWAQLGEPDAVVEESAPNELSIRVQDLSWKVSLDEEGRVTISGFDSGAEQYVGSISDENVETAIVKISDNVQQLIAEDIDEKSVPPEPPVHFGPDDTNVVDQASEEPSPPAAPEGDEGMTGAPPPMGAEMPGDMGAPPGGSEAFPPPGGAPSAGPPPMPAPGGAPPAAPGAPPPFPAASRRRRMVVPRHVVRVANTRLESVSNQLENIGESLGDDGEEVFGKLADRVRRVVDLLR